MEFFNFFQANSAVSLYHLKQTMYGNKDIRGMNVTPKLFIIIFKIIQIYTHNSYGLYLCMRHLVISVLISLDQELSVNVGFVWSKTGLKPHIEDISGDVTDVGRITKKKAT